MKQDEAEKLARNCIELHNSAFASEPCICPACQIARYVVDDMRREIENAAYQNAMAAIEDLPAAMFSGDYDAAIKNRAYARNQIKRFITPAKTADTEG